MCNLFSLLSSSSEKSNEIILVAADVRKTLRNFVADRTEFTVLNSSPYNN